ncbi:MAG: protein-L-isoaspartate O-methyltransferase family protein, partial [Candidatus Dormibacteraceae bacterium]
EPELAEAARATLARLGLENVKVVTGDGHLGWPPQAPYEAILVAAAPVELPPLLVGQLAAGGRLVAPVGPEGDQQLRAYTWAGRRLESRLIFPVRFVPLRRPPTTP